MSILVTGGAGFIGSNFILDWIDKKNEVIVNVDKLSYAGNLENLLSIKANPNYFFIQGDIKDRSLLGQIFSKFKPRAVINFAAESHVDRSIYMPDIFIQTNVVGTFNLLEATRSYFDSLPKNLKKSFRFLQISTDEIYGSLKMNEPPFVEENCYKPNNLYSATKAAGNHLSRAYYKTYEVPTIILNSSNNYGPYHFPEKLIPLSIANALSGKLISLYGDGKQIRDWLYVKDHCYAIRLVLENGSIGESYNIGGHCEKTNEQIIEMICSFLDLEYPRTDKKSYKNQIVYIKDRLGHDFRYSINTSKIEKNLGWKPQENFEKGIKKTVRWYIHHMEWWKKRIND
ncbi:MAG: dTDP-glucose 4,6-dehydratase [Bordetella sp.]|nr:MAG: dTDP-glucose 4,6-dehydratase [Bordetella sp.]